MKNQKGFTLIELIVVIVILGILAATAMPKFIDMQRNARVAAVNGIVGGLRSAALLAVGQYSMTASSPFTTSDGTSVTVYTNTTSGTGRIVGMPTVDLAGIGAMMGCAAGGACQGMNVSVGTASGATTAVLFTPAGGNSTNADATKCTAAYFGTGDSVAYTGGC